MTDAALSTPADSGSVSWPSDERHAAFDRWLAGLQSEALELASVRLASADAAFRRYLRVDSGPQARIIMDAPPALNDNASFVRIAGQARDAGLHVPEVLAWNEADGFLLLTDLGDEPYLAALQKAVAAGDTKLIDALMRDAIETLVQWQCRIDASSLPAYDEVFLRRELALFPQWCVEREFGRRWTPNEEAAWEAAAALLVRSALAQPKLAMHRDFMPRNLMRSVPNPGLLDFQDAVRGPVTYDIASLLRDAFISWDEAQEIDWAVRYWERARAAGVPVEADFGEFWRQFEWMGLQRHLKILGIFCRLKHRDAKPAYTADLPRFFGYALRVCARYNGFGPLARLLEPLAHITRQAGLSF